MSEEDMMNMIKRIVWERQESFKSKLDMTCNWDYQDYIIAMNSKLGTINDMVKMINLDKISFYDANNKFKDLFGDLFIYLFIMCNVLNMEPFEILQNSFNKKSKEINCDVIL